MLGTRHRAALSCISIALLTTKGLQHDIIYRLAHCEAVSNGVTR